MPQKKHVPLPALTADERAANHRRQVRNQIWLPLIAALVIVLGLAGLAIFGTVNQSTEVNRWGSLSAILLILPNLLTSLVSIVALIYLTRGVRYLHRKMPGWMVRWQAFMARVSAYIHRLADQTVRPVLSVNSVQAGVKAFGRKIGRNRPA